MSAPLIDELFDAHSGALTNWYVGHNSYSTEVLADRPAGYWRLNEKTGTSLRGMMSTNVDGTLSGTYTLGTTGPMGDGLTSILFGGGNGALPGNLFTAANNVSVEAWIKINGVGGSLRNIVGMGTDGVSLAITSAGKATFRIQKNSTGTVATAVSVANVDDNVWHHLVGTYDGATIKIYVDGVVASTAISDAIRGYANTATIGAVSLGSTTYNGQVANIAFYDQKALSSTRVTAHYNAGIGAVNTALTPFLATNQYYLRSIVNTNRTVPFTMNDMNYWNSAFFNGMTMTQMNTGTVITTANETWAGGGVTVAADATQRYMPVASAVVTVGSTTTFDTTIIDNIANDFNTAATTYNIDILADFPAQASDPHPDLTNSFVDFSSDAGYAAGKTDSLALSSSGLSLTGGGGGLPIRFTTAQLVNCDPTSLKHVRFRIAGLGTAAGTFTFKVRTVRLYPAGRTFDTIDIDTRRGMLQRALPYSFPATTQQVDAPPIFRRTSAVKNYTQWVRFQTGHAPVASTGSNKLSLLARFNESNGEFIQVELKTNTSESRIRIFENFEEVYSTAAASNVLTDSTEYFLKLDVNGTFVEASVYKTSGVFPGALVYTTGRQTVRSQYRGYVGLWFQPYNYDFTIDSIRASGAQLASVESTVFSTITPVMGLSITPKSSGEINLLDGVTLIPSGDATLSSSSTIGKPAPSERVQRTGVSWYGGFESSTYLPISTPKMLRVGGDIFVNTSVQGTYRIVLRTASGIVAFMRTIPVRTPNKWVSFDFTIHGDFLPGDYKVMVQQVGFFGSSFYLDNVCVCQPSLYWEASCDGGTNWYPFGAAIGKQYSALNFPSKGNQVKMRASSLDTTAWVQGYEIVPLYGYLGRT